MQGLAPGQVPGSVPWGYQGQHPGCSAGRQRAGPGPAEKAPASARWLRCGHGPSLHGPPAPDSAGSKGTGGGGGCKRPPGAGDRPQGAGGRAARTAPHAEPLPTRAEADKGCGACKMATAVGQAAEAGAAPRRPAPTRAGPRTAPGPGPHSRAALASDILPTRGGGAWTHRAGSGAPELFRWKQPAQARGSGCRAGPSPASVLGDAPGCALPAAAPREGLPPPARPRHSP